MIHLRVVLQVIKVHQLFAKYNKWEFELRSVDFFNHNVSSVGIDVDQKLKKRQLRIVLYP